MKELLNYPIRHTFYITDMVKAFVLFIVVVLTIKVIKSCTEPDPVFADGTASSESRFIDSTVADSVFTYIQLQNGICYAQVMSVIRKKIAYQRNKDRAFLVNLAYRFLGMCGANGKRTSAVFTPDR